jgi:hypothetical protein
VKLQRSFRSTQRKEGEEIPSFIYAPKENYLIVMVINEATIAQLLRCEKILRQSINSLEYKRRHAFTNSVEAETELSSENGRFILKIRINKVIDNDFSVILLWEDSERRWHTIRRHNSNTHNHTNVIEKNDTKWEYHKHMITERYQNFGDKEEDYAEATQDYNSVESAINSMMNDCNIHYSRQMINRYV